MPSLTSNRLHALAKYVSSVAQSQVTSSMETSCFNIINVKNEVISECKQQIPVHVFIMWLGYNSKSFRDMDLL
jgi:hypothetical protein